MAVTRTFSLESIRGEFQANGSTAGDQSLSNVVALGNGGYAVVYRDPSGGGSPRVDIYDSATDTTPITVDPTDGGTTDMVGEPVIAFNPKDNSIVAVWREGPGGGGELKFSNIDLTGAVLNREGTLAGPGLEQLSELSDIEVVANPAGGFSLVGIESGFGFGVTTGPFQFSFDGDASDPAIAFLSGGGTTGRFATVEVGSGNDLTLRLFDGSKAQIGTFPLATSAASAPQLAPLSNGYFAAVYKDADFDGRGEPALVLKIFDEGLNLSSAQRVDLDAAREEFDPEITVLPGNFILVTYTEAFSATDSDIRGRIFDIGGAPVAVNGVLSEINLDRSSADGTQSSVAALSDGAFVTTWTDTGGDGDGSRISARVDRLVATLTGDGDSNHLKGGATFDRMFGGGGDDVLHVAAGDTTAGETYDGGDGVDTLELHGTGTSVFDFTGVTVNDIEVLKFSNDRGGGATARFTAAQMAFSSVVFDASFADGARVVAVDLAGASAFSAPNVVNARATDRFEITGGDGDQTINGSAIADIITGGGGKDTLNGGDGDDTFVVNGGREVVAGETYNGGTGTDTLRLINPGDSGGATIFNFQSSEITSIERVSSELLLPVIQEGTERSLISFDASDLGTGIAPDAVFTFQNDATVSFLSATATSIDLSRLTIDKPAGADVLFNVGLTGSDASRVVVGTSVNDHLTTGDADDNLSGGAGNDTLDGGGGVDVLIGGAGDDILDGGPVDDPATQGNFLFGGEGNDTYHVRNTFDLVDEGYVRPEFGFGGNDTIVSSANWFWDVYGIGEVDRVAEDAADPYGAGVTFVGGIFDNELIGHSGTDILFGRGGNDTYIPGDGIDWISLSTLGLTDQNAYAGVDGHNTIVATPRTSGAMSYDIMFEFDPARDKVDVSAYVGQYASGADVLSRAVDDGAGSSYIALGDGLDYLYFVGLTKGQLLESDFAV